MKAQSFPANKICLPAGFSFSASCAGIKASGRSDLALVQACQGTTAAAMFTKNRVVAAPLVVGRASLAGQPGTHSRGDRELRQCELRHRAIRNKGLPASLPGAGRIAWEYPPAEVFPSSTGIIGVPLPVNKIVSRLPDLAAGTQSTQEGIASFAQAIMTTDTRPKLAGARISFGKRGREFAGDRKGSGHDSPSARHHARLPLYRYCRGPYPTKTGSAGCVRRHLQLHLDRRRHFHK